MLAFIGGIWEDFVRRVGFGVFSLHSGRQNDPTGEAVVLEDAELRWPNETPLLCPMTFTVPAPVQGQSRAHLTVVLGAVGTGKSGLLQVRCVVQDPMKAGKSGWCKLIGSFGFLPFSSPK